MEGKVCTKCGEWKSFGDFNKAKRYKNGHQPSCRECQRKIRQNTVKKMRTEYHKQYYQDNKGKIKEQSQQYYQANKEKITENRHLNKDKIAEQNKQYYQANKEKLTEQIKKYRQDNKEKYSEYHKEYYQVNKEEIIERAKQYRQVNIEKIYKCQKQYREANTEKIAEYRQSNKDKITEQRRHYRQTKRGREAYYKGKMKRRSYKHKVLFTSHQRKEILDRDSWTCQCCGIKVHDRNTGDWNTPDKAHIDHIIPISKGGNSEPKNLRVLCRTCNLSKQDKLDEQLTLL